MNLTRKLWIALAFWLLFAVMTPTALAASDDGTGIGAEDGTGDASGEDSSFWEDVKGAGSEVWQSAKEHAPGWWQSIKDAASSAKDAVQEHGPDWVEAAKDKGSELLDKGADALQNAGEQVSGFLEDQQNQFWERTEQQIYGGSPSSTAPDPASSAPASSAPASAPPESSPPASSPPVSSVPPDSAPDASSAPAESLTPDTDSTPLAQDTTPEYSPGHTVVADGADGVDEDTTNAEGAEPAEGAEVTSGPNMTFVWLAISFGLGAIACGSLHTLLNRER